MDKLTKAINFAAIKHRDQRRKDEFATPYINHPIEVMNLLAQAGVTDVDILCAAVLHDTIEDTQTTVYELLAEFGENVTTMVRECTDDKLLPKIQRKKLQIEHVEGASVGAKLVKLGDKISNMSGLKTHPPKSWTEAEITGYVIWCYAVYMGMKGINEQLDKQILEIFDSFGVLALSVGEFGDKLRMYYKNIS